MTFLKTIDNQVGFDEIADNTDYTDEETKEICRVLADKGWLQIGESDIYYNEKKEKMFLNLKPKMKIRLYRLYLKKRNSREKKCYRVCKGFRGIC